MSWHYNIFITFSAKGVVRCAFPAIFPDKSVAGIHTFALLSFGLISKWLLRTCPGSDRWCWGYRQFTQISTQTRPRSTTAQSGTPTPTHTHTRHHSQGKRPRLTHSLRWVSSIWKLYKVPCSNLHKGAHGRAAQLVCPHVCTKRGSSTQEVVGPAWRGSAKVSQRKPTQQKEVKG